LEFYGDVASFCSPDVCFQDARKYISDLSERRAVDAAIAVQSPPSRPKLLNKSEPCTIGSENSEFRSGSWSNARRVVLEECAFHFGESGIFGFNSNLNRSRGKTAGTESASRGGDPY